MLRLPLETEVEVATLVAAKAGLGSITPEVLHLGNHTTVRLNPLPIVARIASGTSFDFSQEGLARELAVGSHLALRGAPSVRPSSEPAPGPYFENDCAVTLWQFVDGRRLATKADEFLAADSLHLIHKALAGIDIGLPPFTRKVDSCDAILANPADAPKLAGEDRLFLHRVYAALREKLGGCGAAWQPLHGDSHLYNALVTPSGAVWMDLEAACVGPLEWDVVNLPVATWSKFPALDRHLLRLLAEVRSLCVAVWCWAEFDRSPASAEAATYHLGRLKERFG
jgi:hypothetical protein